MPDSKEQNTFEVPEIRPAQFGLESSDRIKPDVNLFRGDVNCFVPLIAIDAGGGVDIKLSAQYGSNINTQRDNWNLDAPTSILGLGWHFPLQSIQADYGVAGTFENATLFYVANGIRNRIYPTLRHWQRGVLSNRLINELNNDDISQVLLASLLSQGLLISPSARLCEISNGTQWQLFDSENELSLRIEKQGATLAIFDGGLNYELESFDFTRISYYPSYQRWQLIDKNGIVYSFGGGVSTSADDNKISRGNSIAWNVKWGTWHGPSAATHNQQQQRIQQQYPTDWHLVNIHNNWGRAIDIHYQQTTQLVGNEGLAYTKAIYLQEVSNNASQTAQFSYAKKVFSPGQAGIREYLDPNKKVPDNSPDAYQSKYEDCYLQSICLKGVDDELISTLTFDYSLQQYLVIPANADPDLHGDSYKRTLTAITLEMANGARLPAETFSYNKPNEVNPGALEGHSFPHGAITRYHYLAQELPVNARNMQINSPTPNSIPRVWFGPDYAVVCWYMPSGQLSIEVHTWSGRWIKWLPKVPSFAASMNIEQLNVVVQNDFFVLYYLNSNGLESRILSFHKDPLIFGSWLENEGNPQTVSTTQIELVGGDNFYVINNYLNNQVVRYCWDNLNKQWQQNTLYDGSGTIPGSERYFISAAANTLIALKYDQVGMPGRKKNCLELFYLSADRVWHKGDSQTDPDLTVYGDAQDNFYWSASSWLFAASYVTQDKNTNFDYAVALYRWTEQYKFEPVVLKNYRQASVSSTLKSVPWIATITTTGMVVSGPNLLRFNGVDWLVNDNLKLQTVPDAQNLYWFAQENDLVIKCENTPSQIIAQAQSFDPNTHSTIWQEAAVSLLQSAPAQSRLSHYLPTIGQNFASFDNAIYYRGSSSGWDGAFNTPQTQIASDANITSLVNAGPSFMAWLNESDGTPQGVVLKQLSNGTVQDAGQVLDNFFTLIDKDGQQQGGAGELPVGINSFLTYQPMSVNFDQASSLILHRYLDKSLLNNLTDSSVYKVEIDAGLTKTVTHYEYDINSAAIDSSGTVVKFYSVKSWVADGKKYGYEHFQYYNSLKTSAQNNNPDLPAVLDGLLQQHSIFNAQDQEVKRETTDWLVETRIKSEPHASETSPINGVYVLVKNKKTMLDGVDASMQYDYDLATGEVIQQTSDLLNVDGQKQVVSRQMLPACHVYERLFHTNELRPVAQTKSLSSLAKLAAVITEVKATTWKAFSTPSTEANLALSVWASCEQYTWLGDSSVIDFDFESGSDNPPPHDFGAFTGWLLESSVLSRNILGAVAVQQDIHQQIQTTLFDKNAQFPVARCQSAAPAEPVLSYYGFEPYEAAQGWHWCNGAKVITNNSYTGSRSLQLAQNSQLTQQFLLSAPGADYVLGFWYRTAAEFRSNANAGWSVCISDISEVSHSSLLDRRFYPFEATDGEWKYAFVSIQLPAVSAVSMDISAVNDMASDVLLDNVQFYPEQSQFSANVYGAGPRLLLNRLGLGLQQTAYYYDRFNYNLGQSAPYLNQIAGLSSQFLSCSTAPTFNVQVPNQFIQLTTLAAGVLETFRHGDAWLAQWAASNLAQNWQLEQGMLLHASSADDTLTSNVAKRHFALFFELFSLNGKTAHFSSLFSVEFGTSKVVWDPQTELWTCQLAGQQQQILAVDQQAPSSIHFISTDHALLVYVNEQLLVSATLEQTETAKVIIDVGSNQLAFKNLTLIDKPKLNVLFLDGSNNIHQNHTLIANNSIISQAVYDARGKLIVTTKNAFSHFGMVNKTQPLMTYHQHFVDVPDFLANIELSGKMQGLVADYYNGEHQVSNDESYPYLRNRLEASPLARVVEEGLPGKNYAIVDQLTRDAAERNTKKFNYGNNTSLAIHAAAKLPDNSYYVETLTDEMGVTSACMLDKSKTNILKSAPGQVSKVLVADNPIGAKTVQYYPNYFDGSVTGAEHFVQHQQRNTLKQLIMESHPDSGSTQYVYNAGGLLRFRQDATGADEQYYSYFKYDCLNRLIEMGIFHGGWDLATLRRQAIDRQWPSNEIGQLSQKSYRYTGYADSVEGLGLLAQASVFNQHNQVTVTEMYRYDARNMLADKQVKLSQQQLVLDDSTTRYTYSFTGKIKQIIYPKSAELKLSAVINSYDESDRIVAIGDSENISLYQSYQYNADGSLRSSAFNQDKQQRCYSYYSPGWIKAQTQMPEMDSFNPTISARYANGNVKQLVDKSVAAQVVQTVTADVSFDEAQRLSTACYQSHPAWDLEDVKYDSNGNPVERISGGKAQSFSYNAGSDQLQQMTTKEQPNYSLSYTKNGAVCTANYPSAAKPRLQQFSYVKGSSLSASVLSKDSGHKTLFAYGNNEQRVLKQSYQDNSRQTHLVYIYGQAELPLAQCSGDSTTAYIYGPQGLVAFNKDGLLYYVSKDHLGSTRLVQDSQGTIVAQYTYDSYGNLVDVKGTDSNIISYRYTGQEWDAELDLYNYKARFYCPQIGSFYAVDPKYQTASPYLYANDDPFDYTDPSGESFLGDIFSGFAQLYISTAEIVSAVVIDVATAGAGTAFTGGLLGAGINGATDVIGSAAQGKGTSWGHFFESQAVGAVSGALTAGLGSYAGAAGKASFSLAEENLNLSVRASKLVASSVELTVSGAAASVGSAAGRVVANAIDGNPLGEGVAEQSFISFSSAVMGKSFSLAGNSVIGPQASLANKAKAAIITTAVGGAGGAAHAAISASVQGKHLNGLDLGLAIFSGSFHSALSIRSAKPAIRFTPASQEIELQTFP